MSKENFAKFMEKYMFVVGIAGQMLFYIQALKIFTAKDAGEVSLPAYTLGLISLISWLIYGIVIKNRVLVVSNIVAVFGAVLVIAGILLYQS